MDPGTRAVWLKPAQPHRQQARELAAARCNLQGHAEDDEAATVCLFRGSEGPVDTRRTVRFGSYPGEVKLVDACGMRRERFEDVTKETGERMEARVGHGLTGSRMLDGYVQVLESAQESVWHSDERSGSMTAGSAQHLEGGGQRGGQWANVVSSCGASDRHGLRPARVHSPT